MIQRVSKFNYTMSIMSEMSEVTNEETISQLNVQIDELLQENKELRAQNNRFEVERDELLDENRELKNHIDDLQQELRAMREQLYKLEDMMSNMQNE